MYICIYAFVMLVQTAQRLSESGTLCLYHVQARIYCSMCEKYMVLARLGLLCLIVRGLHGVVAIGVAVQKPKIEKLFREYLTSKSWRILRKHIYDNLESPKKAQHSEGRIASLSGNHPLHALCTRAQAREAFETCARCLASMFARFDVRGYHITVQDVKDVFTSVRGNGKNEFGKYPPIHSCMRRRSLQRS